MGHDDTPSPGRLSITIMLVAAAALAGYFAADSRDHPAADLGSGPRTRPSHAHAPGSLSRLEAPDSPTNPTSRVVAQDSPSTPARVERLRCLDRRTAAPLPGIRAFLGNEEVSGPSTASGMIELTDVPAYGTLTLWTQGWSPEVLRLDELPEEVSFVPDDASLIVRTLHPDADWHLFRGLLQPRSVPAPPEGPWTAVFVEEARDTYTVRRAPPGTYDIYLWLATPEGMSRSLSRASVRLQAGVQTELTFDLAELPPDEAQEDDT